WYKVFNKPITTVSLNGSLIGHIHRSAGGELAFGEVAAFPLSRKEIKEAIEDVGRLLDGGIMNLLVFYYPRDWRIGEVIWTPVPANVIPVREKYRSASAVTAVKLPKL